MASYLLDTHSFLWANQAPGNLSEEALATLANPLHSFFVSAASVWEIAVKRGKGQLRFDGSVVQAIQSMRLIELPITGAHSEASAMLPMLHRDPFDRLLIAQAQAEGMTIITRDKMISAYGVAVLKA